MKLTFSTILAAGQNWREANKPNAEVSAAVFGCTVQQAKRLFAKNADGFRAMAEKAERTGERVNGYSAEELRRSEAEYRAASLS